MVAAPIRVPVVPACSTRESRALSAAPATPVANASSWLRICCTARSAAARSSAHHTSGSGSPATAAVIWSSPAGTWVGSSSAMAIRRRAPGDTSQNPTRPTP